jgi:hypothetical protein
MVLWCGAYKWHPAGDCGEGLDSAGVAGSLISAAEFVTATNRF